MAEAKKSTSKPASKKTTKTTKTTLVFPNGEVVSVVVENR